LSALTLDHILALFEEYVCQTGQRLDVLLIGRLALYAYGSSEAQTDDVDAELRQDVERVGAFLKQHGVPSNLSENISGWSIVALPPGYRDRAKVLHERENLRVALLEPADFVISKLRRGTEQDFTDAEFVARRYGVTPQTIQAAADAALAASPKDTALFVFRKAVSLFLQRLEK
jgi:Nucleotidyltransferase of unknown function (DUF6036)